MRELRLRKEKQPLTAMGMQTRPHLCAALPEAMLDGKRKTNRPRKDRKRAQSHTAVRCRSQARVLSVSPGFRSLCPLPCLSTKSFLDQFWFISHRLCYSAPHWFLPTSVSLQSRLSFVMSCASDSLKLQTGPVLSLHGIKSTRLKSKAKATNQINKLSERLCSICTRVSVNAPPN